jgi:hypothetical protein
VWPGLYGTHVQRYLDVFDARQVCIQLYEDFVAAPSRVYRDVLTFLGVDPSFPLDARVRHNVTRVPRTQQLAAPALAPIKRIVRRLMPNEAADAVRDRYLTKPHGEARADERDALIGLYRDEILLLQTLIGRDLSAWLSADRAVA